MTDSLTVTRRTPCSRVTSRAGVVLRALVAVLILTASVVVAPTTPVLGEPVWPTGGTVTELTDDGTRWRIHTFDESDVFVVHEAVEVEYLVLGGGGGGGAVVTNGYSGGGGAGGVLNNIGSPTLFEPRIYGVTVGLGGGPGQNGAPSALADRVGAGGGAGGSAAPGAPGGSGGGSRGHDTSPGGAGTAGQGHSGGSGHSNAAGGGGGAGSPGANATANTAGPGGASVDLSAVFGPIGGAGGHFAGGGGGGGSSVGGVAAGGGASAGDGAVINGPYATSAVANTGSGGGGGRADDGHGSGSGGSGIVAVRYIVGQAPHVDTHPVGVTVAPGEDATFEAAATGIPTPSVAWQRRVGGGDWTTIPGATGSTLTVPGVGIGAHGDQVRAVFTNTYGAAASDVATLTVTATAPAITTHPTDTTVVSGETAVFTAAAGGAPNPTTAWERSVDGGTWELIDGETNPTLVIPAVVFADGGTRYRAVFENMAGDATTDTATLTVTASNPVITTHPADTTVVSGEAAEFAVAVSGDPEPSLEWYRSADHGATWAPIDGETDPTLTVPSPVFADGGTRYRVVVTNEAGTVVSNSATLTVTASDPVVTAHPADTTVISGEKAVFTAAAAGDPTPTVQWERSDDGGSTWAPIDGETNTTLTVPAVVVADGGTQFRAVFTVAATGSHVVSDPATLSVDLAAGTAPVLSVGARTIDGFSVRIDNYDSAFTYKIVVSDGAVSRDGSTIVVSGLAPGSSATLTVTAATPETKMATATVVGHALAPGPVVVPSVPPGDTQMLIGGSPAPVTTSIIGGTTLELVAKHGTVTVTARTADGTPVAVNASGSLVLSAGGTVVVSGDGLAPGSTVGIWLHSTPVLLGEVTVGADGSFRAELPLGPITPGDHTLVLRGVGSNDEEIAYALGVTVVADNQDTASTEDTAGTAARISASGADVVLPDTGSTVVLPLVAATLLLAAGSITSRVSARHRT